MAAGGVLGSFGTSSRQSGDPTDQEMRLCRRAARLSGIAIERQRSEEQQRTGEERFRLAAEAVDGIIYEADHATGRVERTRGLFEVLGFRPDEVPPTTTGGTGKSILTTWPA